MYSDAAGYKIALHSGLSDSTAACAQAQVLATKAWNGGEMIPLLRGQLGIVYQADDSWLKPGLCTQFHRGTHSRAQLNSRVSTSPACRHG